MSPPGFLPPVLSLLFVYVLGLGGGLGVMAFAWIWRGRHRQRAADAAEAAKGAHGKPRRGPVCLAGVVVPLDDDVRPLVRVSIRQRGKEWRQKGRWRTGWREVARQTEARPFLLRLEGGGEVRVEPNEQVLLVDQLTEIVRDARDARRRIANVHPGEKVYVTGVYQPGGGGVEAGPFRGDGGPGRLVPPRGDRMLVSTEPPTERHQRRARVHHRLFWVAGVYLVLALVASAQFLQLQLSGKEMTGQVVDQWSYEKWHSTKRGGYWKTHYAVAAETRAGVLHTEIPHALWVTRPATVPMIVASSKSYVFGEDTSLNGGRASFLFMIALALGLFAPLSVIMSRDWWDKKLSDTENGRLDDGYIT
jgi:hypothetical protein